MHSNLWSRYVLHVVRHDVVLWKVVTLFKQNVYTMGRVHACISTKKMTRDMLVVVVSQMRSLTTSSLSSQCGWCQTLECVMACTFSRYYLLPTHLFANENNRRFTGLRDRSQWTTMTWISPT